MTSMTEVYVNTIRHGQDTVVAVCDADLLGQTIEGGPCPFTVSERFYGGDLSTISEALQAIGKASIVNMVGIKIVAAAIEDRRVHPNAVIYFGEIPHAQIIR